MDLFIKFLVAAIGAGTPLLFGTVGEILNEKVGHLNLGVEGMMAIGACAGFMGGYLSDNFLVALLCAFVAGMLAALIYACLLYTSPPSASLPRSSRRSSSGRSAPWSRSWRPPDR